MPPTRPACRRACRLLPAALLAAALAAAPAALLAAPDRPVDVQVVDRSAGAGPLPLVEHRGTAWVAGRPGDRYAVRLANRTGERVMVVLSVDGVNAVTGETASVDQVGYVLAPWQTFDVTGWRKSDRETAAFYFTSVADSYAGRTERPQHVGVIGAAVFRERVVARPAPAPVESARGSSEPAQAKAEAFDRAIRDAAPPPASPPAAGAATDDLARGRSLAQAESAARRETENRLGTGHGERVWSPIWHTSFEKATSRPADVVQIRYDSHRNLVAAGILPSPRPAPRPVPNPFPGYVPDPA